MAGTLHLHAVDRFPLQLGTHLPGGAHIVMPLGKDNRRQLLDRCRSVGAPLTPVLQRIPDDDDAHD